ncbi:unnamed protein product [marine sediment metagenome]|uniref:Uncharacterized protein n=1 Tax=marine sediment metagenome TaxID=412755 RepID=X1FHT2_9ZZZZ
MIVGQTVEGDEIGKDITIKVKDLLLNVEIFGMIGRGINYNHTNSPIER